jgi:hypothetical protein
MVQNSLEVMEDGRQQRSMPVRVGLSETLIASVALQSCQRFVA